MNQTKIQSSTKTKLMTGLIIAGVVILAAGAGWVIKVKMYTPQGTIPILKYDTSTGEVSNPVVNTAQEILAGPDRDTSLDFINTNYNTNNSNTNGNANDNTNTTNTNTGPDDVTKNP